ncbi:hypothetical protein BRADI_1g41326v3 [Brachypodium distachyon]|uniref:Uncharacterized protein n=1 Tax=Brachypodium distachyon TaxID=15368 RepID=A0A0Q3H5X8_BRADI|nr:hypothetical protein BRADI_1g41326v3 [Brachypodium distachyon]
MSNIVNDNCGSGNGSGGQNGGRQVVQPLQLNLGPMVAAPPAVAVEEGDGGNGSNMSWPTSCVSSDGSPSREDVILCQSNRCFTLCIVTKKEFPRCLNCKWPSLLIRNVGDRDQSSSK